jgi:hypothetical protein
VCGAYVSTLECDDDVLMFDAVPKASIYVPKVMRKPVMGGNTMWLVITAKSHCQISLPKTLPKNHCHTAKTHCQQSLHTKTYCQSHIFTATSPLALPSNRLNTANRNQIYRTLTMVSTPLRAPLQRTVPPSSGTTRRRQAFEQRDQPNTLNYTIEGRKWVDEFLFHDGSKFFISSFSSLPLLRNRVPRLCHLTIESNTNNACFQNVKCDRCLVSSKESASAMSTVDIMAVKMKDDEKIDCLIRSSLCKDCFGDLFEVPSNNCEPYMTQQILPANRRAQENEVDEPTSAVPVERNDISGRILCLSIQILLNHDSYISSNSSIYQACTTSSPFYSGKDH